MSKFQLSRRSAHMGVAALFMIAMLAPIGSAEVVISSDHVAAARAHENGAVLPAGWSKLSETVRFHLHSDTPTEPDAIPVGEELTDGYLNYEAPTARVGIRNPLNDNFAAEDPQDANDKRVITINDLDIMTFNPFFQATGLAVTEDVRVYSMSGSVRAVCGGTDPENVPDGFGPITITPTVDVGINFVVRSVAPDGTKSTVGTLNMEATGSNLPARSTYTYTGSWSNGNPAQENGHLVDAGDMIEIEVIPDTIGTTCELHFDSEDYPAWFEMTTDSARIATWTETAQGQPTVGLADASKTQASERRFTTVIAQASAWPQYNDFNKTRSGTHDYLDRYSWNNNDLRFRIRDLGDPVTGRNPVSPPFVDATQNTATQNDDEIQILNARCLDPLTWDDDKPPCSGSLGFANDGVGGHSFKRKLPLPINVGDAINVYELQWAYPGGANALPNGQYRFEVYSGDFGVAQAPVVTFGLKDISVSLEGLNSRLVKAGEPTEFRFTLTNNGAEDDTITVFPSTPGANWKSTLDQRTHFLPANGGKATFTLTMTPPTTATVIDSRAVTLDFVSSFPTEVTINPVTVSVAITADDSPGVKITAPRNKVSIQPGQQFLMDGLRVTNQGPALDHFTYVATVAAGNPGWSASVDPKFGAVPAQSLDDLILKVQAPGTAGAGVKVPVTVSAIRVSDASVLASVVIEYTTVVQRNLEIGLDGQFVAGNTAATIPRHNLDQYCAGTPIPFVGCYGSYVEDDQYDPSALFRVELKNTAYVADTFSVQGTWVLSDRTGPAGTGNFDVVDTTGSGSCDGAGNPDGWRVNLVTDPTLLNGNAHGGSQNSNSKTYPAVTVPARSVKTVYVELGWIEEFAGSCGDQFDEVSPAAIYDVRVRSTNDPSVQSTVSLLAKTAGNGASLDENDYSLHDVKIAPAPLDVVSSSGRDVVQKVAKGATGVHKLLVQNTGNEKDTLTIAVPASPNGKWERTLSVASTAPTPASCEARNGGLRLVCSNMGVMDEIWVNLNVKASGSTLRVGDRDDASVTVSSAKNGQFTDAVQLQTKVTGAYLFAAAPVDSGKFAAKGQTVRMPYEIENQGTAGDSYELSLVKGDPAWLPRFSEQQVFVPSGYSHLGSLAIKAPAGAANGATKDFVVNVKSLGDPAKSTTFGFVATVRDSGTFSLVANPATLLLADTSSATSASMAARDTTLTRSSQVVDFLANGDDLPAGWGVDTTKKTDSTSTSVVVGTKNTLEWNADIGSITAPAGSLSTSRAILEIEATQRTSGLKATTDVIVELADTYGLAAEIVDGTGIPITPGGELVYRIKVTNQGLSEDNILISTSPITTTGWSVTPSDSEELMGPLAQKEFDILVRAPTNAAQGAQLAFTILVKSASDDTVQVQIPVVTKVGKYAVSLDYNATAKPLGGPGDVLTRTFVINNTGTLPDEYVSAVSFTNQAFASVVDVKVVPARVNLEPGEATTVVATFTMGAEISSDISIGATYRVTSALDPATPKATQSGAFSIGTYRFAARDVDADGIQEYAVDANKDAGDGFESFRDIAGSEGKETHVANLAKFLTAEAKKTFTTQVTQDNNTTEVFRYVIDGDEDGRVDFFLDTTRDNLPDIYWDPDRGHHQAITIFKDVNADGVPDYFVDTSGDGFVDAVFNIKTGKWIALIVIDVDGDGTKDYVVDANDNGQVDDNETVLYSRNGRLITVQKIDMTGNGKLDQVFDVDGDGVPDYFIPFGQTESIPIVLRDVNGDGTADWTYDADGDGDRDSFYNPVDGSAGMINSERVFLDNVLEYWYVAAIFLVVAGLFIVLLFVTRR